MNAPGRRFLRRWFVMRHTLVPPFWKEALASLPSSLRTRYVHEIEAAERWELRLDAAVESFARAKNALTKLFQPSRPAQPRSAHR